MTDPTAPEPTMEEILASIRRIISEDDAPAAAPEPEPVAAAAPAPEPVAAEPAPEPVDVAPAPEPFVAEPEPADDDVLELTDRYEEASPESIGDLDFASPEPAPPVPSAYDSLVGDSAAASAASAFAGLAASFKAPEPAPAARNHDLNFASGATVEGMVAEMLRPMLKDWLDANLPGIVQTAVQKEVERIARSAG
ncbi:DUF2497 domain-containing protein [Brevundimonas variabilis]|uniref:DUF2497 domain-containing protein n=1 Tax=Brevundimonas variabilis TaxID=74312 RepID=A0A7W9FDH6_9CAUL|nr:DUF2497 domain-containing protein [Brevundimonas variabilis]MBB5745421.1 hypothetical protein [Brevundimonas variabilis]